MSKCHLITLLTTSSITLQIIDSGLIGWSLARLNLSCFLWTRHTWTIVHMAYFVLILKQVCCTWNLFWGSADIFRTNLVILFSPYVNFKCWLFQQLSVFKLPFHLFCMLFLNLLFFHVWQRPFTWFHMPFKSPKRQCLPYCSNTPPSIDPHPLLTFDTWYFPPYTIQNL